jgi:hypothetical protein
MGSLFVGGLRTLKVTGVLANLSGGTLTGGTFYVGGTLQITGANITTNSATLTVDAGQIVDDANHNALANLATNAFGASLSILDGFNLTTAGAFENDGTLTVGSGSTLTVTGVDTDTGTSNVSGTLNLSGGGVESGTLTDSGAVNVGAGVTFTVTGTYAEDGALTVPATSTLNLFGQTTVGGSLSDAGTVNLGPGVAVIVSGSYTEMGTLTMVGSATLDVTGTLTNLSGGTLSGGTFYVSGTLQITGASISTNAATVVLDGPGAGIIDDHGNDALANMAANSGSLTNKDGRDLTVSGAFANTGSLTVGDGDSFTSGGTFSNSGAVSLGAGTGLNVTGDYAQSAGSIVLNGTTLTVSGAVNLQGGVLSGSGSINGPVVNAAEIDVGTGTTAATLNINGDYSQPGGVVVIKIGGRNAGTDYDQLNITGNATFTGGTLTIQLIDGFVPDPTIPDMFQIITFGSHDSSDDFATYIGTDLGNGLTLQPQYSATGLTLVANQS